MTCIVEGCTKKKKKRDKMCSMHSSRWCKTGRLDMGRRAGNSLDEWYDVNKDNGCFEFNGCKNKRGYGVIRINGKNALAHRVVYEKHKGKIPAGMLLCHHCDNPSCVNPDHMFIGTPKDNMQDMISKGRQRHAIGERHPRAKLKDKDVLLIRKMAKSGKKNNELSRVFGVSKCAIYQAVNRVTWKHI